MQLRVWGLIVGELEASFPKLSEMEGDDQYQYHPFSLILQACSAPDRVLMSPLVFRKQTLLKGYQERMP